MMRNGMALPKRHDWGAAEGSPLSLREPQWICGTGLSKTCSDSHREIDPSLFTS